MHDKCETVTPVGRQLIMLGFDVDMTCHCCWVSGVDNANNNNKNIMKEKNVISRKSAVTKALAAKLKKRNCTIENFKSYDPFIKSPLAILAQLLRLLYTYS